MRSSGGYDVHSKRPLRRNDVVNGFLYACEYQDFDPDGEPCGVVRASALWVPDAQLLFQWSPPRGVIQVIETKRFPPKEAQAVLVEKRDVVPYPAIQAARRYLKQQTHCHRQEETLQTAMDRITEAATRSEGRFQAVLRQTQLRRS